MATSTTIGGLGILGAAPASGDYLVVLDVSDTTQSPGGSDKRMTVANLFAAPHLTAPVVDSGGLGVTAGGVTVTAGGVTVLSGGATIGGAVVITGAGTTLDNGQFYQAKRNSGSVVIPILGFKTGTDLVVVGHEGSLPDVEIASNNTVIGAPGAIATNATGGFAYMPSCAGTPTGTPATSYTGRVPWIYDSTNHKICVYDGGAWLKTAALT